MVEDNLDVKNDPIPALLEPLADQIALQNETPTRVDAENEDYSVTPSLTPSAASGASTKVNRGWFTSRVFFRGLAQESSTEDLSGDQENDEVSQESMNESNSQNSRKPSGNMKTQKSFKAIQRHKQ